MRIRSLMALLLPIVLMLPSSGSTMANPTPATQENPIRIGLGRSQASAELTSAGGLLVVAGNTVQMQIPPGQVVRFTPTSGGLSIEGWSSPIPAPVRFVPAPETPSFISYRGRTYRGEIEVLSNFRDGKLTVINVVNVEDYLLGVVPEETYASWPIDALRAQAVASRTYALSSLKKYKDEGFDLVDTTGDQKYGGVLSERASTTNAVQTTRGQVITFNGAMISAMYSSSSGGHTENNEIIFPNGLPRDYLRGVEDHDTRQLGNLWATWSYAFSLDQLSSALVSKGHHIGIPKSVAPGSVVGVSGRPRDWIVIGSTGQVVLTAERFRNLLAPPTLLALPSGPKQVVLTTTQRPVPDQTIPAGTTVYTMGADRVLSARSAGGTLAVGADRTPVAINSAITVRGPNSNDSSVLTEGLLAVSGGGRGHAVGMSQWGSYGMAVLGQNYQQILAHYYRNTEIVTR